MSRQYPGYFITLEGGEGCGKTSQITYLRKMFEANKLPHIFTREPGGTPIGEQIRDVVHDKKNTDMHPRTETLLYQAARAQIVEQLIRPQLDAGRIVVADRYFDSTIAYQGYGRNQNVEEMRWLINYATGGLIPDLTILMNVDVEVGLSRKGKTDEWNRMDNQTLDFHQRVHAGYSEMVQREPNRWVVVDANQSYESVSKELRRVIEEKLVFNGLLEGNNGQNAERNR